MRPAAKGFLILYGMMLVGIVVLVMVGKHDTNTELHTIQHDLQVVKINDKVAFPCTAGRDLKCREFLASIVRYASYRQRRAIVGNGLSTPKYLRRYVRHIIIRERQRDTKLISRVKAKILKRRKAHVKHQGVIDRSPGPKAQGNRLPGPSGGQGNNRNK